MRRWAEAQLEEQLWVRERANVRSGKNSAGVRGQNLQNLGHTKAGPVKPSFSGGIFGVGQAEKASRVLLVITAGQTESCLVVHGRPCPLVALLPRPFREIRHELSAHQAPRLAHPGARKAWPQQQAVRQL